MFHLPWVGNTGGGLKRNKDVTSTKKDTLKVCAIPPLRQKQRRRKDGAPSNVARFIQPRVGFAGG
jgi:hypothetical protein